jgi:hypothetical protein
MMMIFMVLLILMRRMSWRRQEFDDSVIAHELVAYHCATSFDAFALNDVSEPGHVRKHWLQTQLCDVLVLAVM